MRDENGAKDEKDVAVAEKAPVLNPGSNLRERVITAAVGLGMLAIWLFFFQTIALNIVLMMLGLLLVYELLTASNNTRNVFVLLVSFVYAAAIPLLTYPIPGIDLPLFRALATFLYLTVLFCVLLFRHREMNFEHLSFAVFVTVAVPLSLSFAMRIRESFPMDGVFLFLLALAGAWLTDTCAYFVGVMFGKHKLAPDISPKKTIEGFFGGIIGNVLLCILLSFLYSLFCNLKGANMTVNYVEVVVYALLASLLSVLGDLSASLIKRQCAIKDFGYIMPGHGGAMDRFDSVLFVLPFTYFFLQFFPILFRA